MKGIMHVVYPSLGIFLMTKTGLLEKVVKFPRIQAFESRLDKYWKKQDVFYNDEAALNLAFTNTDHTDLEIQD